MDRDNLNEHEFEDAAVRRRLRDAVRGVETPSDLKRRVQARLDAADRRRRRAWIGAATAAAMLLAGWSAALRFTGFAPHQLLAHEIFIASVARGLDPLLSSTLGDHIHCAFYRSFPPAQPSRDLVVKELGEEWVAIEEALQEHAPEGFVVRLAHRCRRFGREFVHLALLREQELMSLLLTQLQPGDATAGGEGLASVQAERFAVAGFSVGRYAAFVISELDVDRNLAAARNWVPTLRRFLA